MKFDLKNNLFSIKKYAILLLTIFPLTSVSAMGVEGFGLFNAEFGGDTLVDVTYVDGSKADIDAGRGIVIGGGVNLDLTPDILIQAAAAWKFTTVPQASNGDLTWTRIPLELSAFYKVDKFRAGGGVAYHMSNKLKGTGIASAYNVDFDNALGFNLGAEYLLTPKLSLTARYTIIDYSYSGVSVNGNSFGAGLNWYFMKK